MHVQLNRSNLFLQSAGSSLLGKLGGCPGSSVIVPFVPLQIIRSNVHVLPILSTLEVREGGHSILGKNESQSRVNLLSPYASPHSWLLRAMHHTTMTEAGQPTRDHVDNHQSLSDLIVLLDIFRFLITAIARVDPTTRVD